MENQELYELTQGQSVVVNALKYIKNKEVLNIALEFQIDSEIDLHILMQAVNLATLRNPNNRLQLIQKDDKYYQYYSNEAQDKIEYIELIDEKAYNKYIDEFAKTPFGKDGMSGKLFKISVIKKPNRKIAICGSFSHIKYDAYSSAMFFKETFDIYQAIIDNQPLPKEAYSVFQAYETQAKYLTSKRHESDIAYYEKEYETEPQYTIISGKKAKTYSDKERSGAREVLVDPSYKGESLVFPIDNQFRDAVYEYASKNNITPQIVYMLACRTYLSYVCETDDVIFNSTINKRSTVIEQKAGGTMADTILFRSVFNNNISFKEAINIIHSRLLEYYKHSYLSTMEIDNIYRKKANISNMRKCDSLVFTYQAPTKLANNIDYSIKRLQNGREWVSCYINIIPCNSKNEYVVDYSYMPKLVSEQVIRDYHNFMINFITEGINNDDKKISDIITNIGK